MFNSVCRWILEFAGYSFLGWLCESVYCSIPAKRFINRGFLNGPFCPVYGIGALLVTWLLRPVEKHILLIFLCGTVITTILEYITGFLLEKLFHTKWWDYSKKKIQLHGRICLQNSLLFGVLCVILMAFLHPLGEDLLSKIPQQVQWTVAIFLVIYLIGDTILSVHTVLQFNGKLKQIQNIWEEIERKKKAIREKLQQKVEGKFETDAREKLQKLIHRKKELEEHTKLLQRRLISAFPTMRPLRYTEHFVYIKQEIEKRRSQRKKK